MIANKGICVNLLIIIIINLTCAHKRTADDKIKGKAKPNPGSPKIAIIGAGIGGASSAHYLRQLFGPKVDIAIYEDVSVGGRLANIKVAGQEFEAGGSVIHDQNMYMVNFTRLLGLRRRDGNPTRLGVFADSRLVFTGSAWFPVMLSQLCWRYGWDVYRLKKYNDAFIADFMNIYKTQDAGRSFTTVRGLLASMSPRFVGLLERSIADELHNNGFSEKIISELVSGGIRGNYGQDVDVHAFVGSVSMVGAGSSLWSVEGGNKRVVERLLEEADVDLIRRQATRITHGSDGRYVLESKSPFDGGKGAEPGAGQEAKLVAYDIVVIAAPLYDNIASVDVSAVSPATAAAGFSHRFQRTVATFVQGWPRAELFGVENINAIPEVVLAARAPTSFSALGRQTPVDFRRRGDGTASSPGLPVWMVFSPLPLDAAQLDELFVSHAEQRSRDWLAYPRYAPPYVAPPSFELAERLYFASAMEAAASTMETSVVAARNVALLAHHRWHGRTDGVDGGRDAAASKDEL